ncbi:hypothetical protein K440DRAFT_139045 [Wilcoxina mikolae CBS 423.85]|nr:hypothetical protein K440DRAFT_139045 [Wilcoxina mikolae CBS 423.85]
MSDLREPTMIRYFVFGLQFQTKELDRCPAGRANARLEIPGCYLPGILVPWSTLLACEPWFAIDIEPVVDATKQECYHPRGFSSSESMVSWELLLASAQFHQHLMVMAHKHPFLDHGSNLARMFVQSLELEFCADFLTTQTPIQCLPGMSSPDDWEPACK